jgi:hypothetical protein
VHHELAQQTIPSTTASPHLASNIIRRRSILRKRIASFPVLLGVILAGTIFVFDSGSIADPDIWWHLRNAEVLVTTHSFVRHDLYSFTTAGIPWINEAWLSELPYYVGWHNFGISGVYLVMLLEIELIFLGVFALAHLNSRNLKAAFLVSWLAIWLATVSFGPRTLLAGWMCLVAELLLLASFRQGKDYTWFLPPLFILWVNLHGSWLIGITLFCIFYFSGFLQGNWGKLESVRWASEQRKKLGIVGALSVFGLFLNPYTYHLVSYPFTFAFQQRLNVGHVDEWMSLDFHGIRGKILFSMIAATLILGLVRRRRWRVDELAFVLVGFYAAVTYSRFLFLAAIVVLPILAKDMDFLPRYNPAIDKFWLNGILIAGIIIGCIWRLPSREYLMRDPTRNYPVKALPYLQKFRPDGPVFNDCLWGGYLIWNARQIPVFIDSRIDIYEYSGVFADYLDAIGIKNTLGVLDKYHIRYVLFPRESPVAYLLMHTAGWKTDYQDETTVLLERFRPLPVIEAKGP